MTSDITDGRSGAHQRAPRSRWAQGPKRPGNPSSALKVFCLSFRVPHIPGVSLEFLLAVLSFLKPATGSAEMDIFQGHVASSPLTLSTEISLKPHPWVQAQHHAAARAISLASDCLPGWRTRTSPKIYWPKSSILHLLLNMFSKGTGVTYHKEHI